MQGESRRGLSLPAVDSVSGKAQVRLASAELASLVKKHKVTDWRRFVPESKAEPDYGGVLAGEGRAIYYDAKTTRRAALDFDNLHAHQIMFLERTAGFGAVAGFLVEFSVYGEIYFLPIQILSRWRAANTRKSIPRRFFCENLVPAPAGKGLIIFDYLKAIEVQERRYQRDFSGFPIADRRARK